VCISIAHDPYGNLVAPVSVESRGFLHRLDANELYSNIEEAVEKAVKTFRMGNKAGKKDDDVASRVKSAVRKVLRKFSLSPPVILVMVNEVQGNGYASKIAQGELAR